MDSAPDEIIDHIANYLKGEDLRKFALIGPRYWKIVQSIYLRRIPKVLGVAADSSVLDRIRFINGNDSYNFYGITVRSEQKWSVWTAWPCSEEYVIIKWMKGKEVWKKVYIKELIQQETIITDKSRTQNWYIIGNGGLPCLHRDAGPASIEVCGEDTILKWYIQGLLHREDGPAIERWKNGERGPELVEAKWYQQGR